MDESHWIAVIHELPFRRAVWLFPLAFGVHVIEEWPQFVGWANRYASASFTRRDYLVIHLTGLVGAVVVAAMLSRVSPRPVVFVFFAFLFLPALFWNVVFHVGATVAYRAYCPGVVSAVLIYPPVVYLVSCAAQREGLTSLGSWMTALGIAAVFHVWEVGHNVFKAW